MCCFLRAGSISRILLILLLGAVPHSSAQTPVPGADIPLDLHATALPQTLPSLAPPAGREHGSPQRRPGALLPLYASFASLQVLDAHATAGAIERGAVEVNPMMRGFTGNPVGLLAIKSAGTAGVVWASERMWRRNKSAAVLFLIAANSAMAWVVQHNYRAAR
jgi:hypothetical protein